MALEAGQQLLHYRLIEKIGEGGMGVVWRAQDTTLDREVAIKVLPQAFAADAERLARFEREAKLLASLNHGGIAAIHGLHPSTRVARSEHVPSTRVARSGQAEAADGSTLEEITFLAMELVPGEDLSQRMARGAVPVDEALEIAAQIATALAAAHARGIVHRDLKPANVKLTPEHAVKVLDFGLAKAWATEPNGAAADPALSPTMTSAGTVPGLILGTAAYMAPEQARGRAVDQRADVWALGVILYEMLAGRALFPGEDVSEVLAGVIKTEPDWSALPAGLPRSVWLALRRALTRKPEERLHSAADFRILIEEGRQELAGASDETEAPPAAAPARAAWLPWTLLAVMVVAVLGLQWWRGGGRGRATEATPVQFKLEAPRGGAIAMSNAPYVDVTPDGRTIVFSAIDAEGQWRLFARDLGASEARPLPGTEDAEGPFIAEDGTIGFVARSQLRTLRPGATASTEVCDVADAFYGGAFAPDGSIVFNDDFDAGLMRVRGPGAAPEVLTTPDRARRAERHTLPYVLPGGEGVLFTIKYAGTASDPEGTYEAALLRFDSGEIETVLAGGSGPFRYLPTGHLLLRQDTRLIVLPFDVDAMRPTGDPFEFFEGPAPPVYMFAASPTGTLVYSQDWAWATEDLVWLDREGNKTTITEGPGPYIYVSLSDDGKRVTLSHRGQIWIHELSDSDGGGRRLRLTQEGTSVVSLFSPDGSRVAFGSYQPDENLYWMEADGGPMELLLEADNRQYPLDWDARGNRLVLQWTDARSGYDIWLMKLDGEREARPLLDSPYNERWAQLSPDGRWMAYASDESGRYEIYVVSYPDLRGKRAVSIDGGIEPRWSPRGDEIFFKAAPTTTQGRWTYSTLMAATVSGDATLTFGTPVRVLEGDYIAGSCCGHSYDVAPDGQRFVMVEGIPESERRLNVVLNAFGGLAGQ